MNNIVIKQNEHKQLERLAAQRELYSSAKRYHGWQILLVVILPVALAFLAIHITELGKFTAAYGVLITMVDLLFYDVKIKVRKSKAAKIQELFDCDVLQMNCSPLKTVDDITVEEILSHYDAHNKIPTNIEKIKDWYPQAVAELPISIARIICQRANLKWDTKLRDSYANKLAIFSWIVFVVVIFYGVVKKIEVINILLIGSTLLPFFQFCIKQYLEQKDAVVRLQELLSFVNNLWSSIIDRTKNDEELTEASRRLQDEIFEHRSKTPLILDFFYIGFRAEDEDLLSRTTQKLVDDLKEKGIV